MTEDSTSTFVSLETLAPTNRIPSHIIHRALAVWALGGDAHVIQAGYDHDKSYQRPSFKSPEPITRENFSDHLGDEK